MNLYYSPEKFGLTLFGEVEFAGGYEHDKIAVWRDAYGKFLWGQSSGCSCVGIFDGTGVDDLTQGMPPEFLAFALNYLVEKAGVHSWDTTYYARWNGSIVALFERMVSP